MTGNGNAGAGNADVLSRYIDRSAADLISRLPDNPDYSRRILEVVARFVDLGGLFRPRWHRAALWLGVGMVAGFAFGGASGQFWADAGRLATVRPSMASDHAAPFKPVIRSRVVIGPKQAVRLLVFEDRPDDPGQVYRLLHEEEISLSRAEQMFGVSLVSR